MYPDQAELNLKWLKVHFFGSIFNYLVPRILKMQKNVSKSVLKRLWLIPFPFEFPSRKPYVL